MNAIESTGDDSGKVAPIIDHRAARLTAQGTILNFAAEALSLPAGLVIVVFLSRQFGPELYGTFAVASALVLFLEISVTNLFRAANIKFVAEAGEASSVASALAQLQFLVGLGVAALLIALAPLLAAWFRSEELTLYLQLFAIDIPLFALADALRSALTGQSAYGRRAFLTAIRWVSRVAFVILFVGFGLSVLGAILAIICAVIVELIAARVLIPLSLFRRTSLPLRRLVVYALPLFLFSLEMRMIGQVDLLAVKGLAGTAEAAGFFAAAQNMTMIGPTLFFAAFSPVLLSALASMLHQGQLEIFTSITRQALRFVICLFPFVGLAFGMATEIVTLIYGQSFSPAANLLALLSFAALGVIVISVTSTVLTAAGRPGLPFVLTVPLLPLAIGAHLILVPRFGAVGAASVTAAVSWLGAVTTLIAVHRQCRVFLDPLTIIRSLLTTGLVYFIPTTWHLSNVWFVLYLFGLAALILVLFVVLGEFKRNDLAFAQSLLRREWSN